MEQILRIFDAILADSVNFLFCMVIGGWFVLAAVTVLIPNLARRPTCAKFAAMTPNTLATLGVLGTFTGILIGLLDFDVSRVDASVPQLLAGLKIAFTTSIIGITAAIVFRLLRALAPSDTAAEGLGPEDIYRVLIELRDDGRAAANLSNQQLGELRKAISSEGDTSLLTQVQKLRTTIQDGQTELIREFRQFAEHMVENNQKAIIEALEQVIRDFNTKLTEQFGENFKQLNDAVHNLVTWQDQYRDYVEGLEQRHQMATNSLQAAQIALEQVRAHSERIPEAIKQLEPILSGISAQTSTLSTHLDAIASLRDKAIEAFPVIEGNLEKITTRLSASVEDAVKMSRQTIADAKEAHEALNRDYDGFLTEAQESRERFTSELDSALKQMTTRITQEHARQGELIETSAREAQRVINEAWAKNTERLNDQFNAFDQQMQSELTRALELLGQKLASVSEKLVNDYTPLTHRLRELVELARR
jgi:F0F1-type ATP synthase membrane subunit b/b'